MKWASTIATESALDAAVENAAEQIFKGLGRREPDLLIAFVNCSHPHQAPALPELIRREFESTYLFGCSAEGVIGSGKEVEGQPALALLGAVLPDVEIRGVQLSEQTAPPAYAERSLWEAALRTKASAEPKFLLLADPFTFSSESLLKGLDRAFPCSPKLGGLASGARQSGEAALFLDDATVHSGVIALALTGDIELDTIVAQGCRPVGDPMFATATHENLIRELDGRSPRDVLADLFEQLPVSDRELFSDSLCMGIALCSDVSEYRSGDFLMRNILGMDPQSGSLWINAALPPHSVVQMHLRDAVTCAQDLDRMLSGYRRQLSASPMGALLFSCMQRGMRLYGQPDHDSNSFRRIVGDTPLGGFFCNGEIGPVRNTTHLHGYTSAFGIFRPKQPST